MKEVIIYIQHMISSRDILMVSNELERLGLRVKGVELGTASFLSTQEVNQQEIDKALTALGYKVIQKEEKKFADQVKISLADYLLEACKSLEGVSMISGFMEEKLNMPYSTLSKRFRKIEGRTIDSYLTSLRVKEIKKLVSSGNLSVEEIAKHLNYQSSRSFAKNFRDATGFSLRDFKKGRKGNQRIAGGI